MSREEAIKEINEMIGHMIGPFGEEPECSALRSIRNKLLESEPEPGDPTLQELAEQLHNIYQPNCNSCSYTDNDWAAVKKVILPIIDRLTTEVKAGKDLWIEAQTRRKYLALEVDDLQAELKAKDNALQKYGSHTKECDSHNQDRNTMGMGLTQRRCDCGFEQALKGGD